ncbi:helix-turn-helix domain-containing protein [Aureimonas sp. AU40]|uniref:helix-turn-helix domain-containing protein n=1 Tax=Aureimonas sp. AU40 TaxID=1637747 RepID=UPI00078481E8|nr:helix-turn-helix domain-containing protein [Aureimonas sp. AU40]
MILVPLPFLVSLLLVTILFQALRRDGDGFRANPLFTALIAAYALQSVLVGLRWGYDLRAVLPVMSPLAALIAPLAWLSFDSLARDDPPLRLAAIVPHLLPVALVVALMLLWPDPVGAVIAATFAGYGAALLWRARLGPDGLVASRLDGVLRSYRALQITGVALLASAATDILVSLDFAVSGGTHSGAMVAVGNVATLLVLGAAASVASSSSVEVEADATEPAPDRMVASLPTKADLEIANAIEALMRDKELYRDVDLNLEKIARKLGLPARDVSNAINRTQAMSVSQYVNTHRVKRACRLLRETGEPVTKIMFDSGFGTKSNFNREFLRVTATTPSAYRRAGGDLAATPPGETRQPVA